MANRYWVGGDGTWDGSSTAHWASVTNGAPGASAPTSSDTVIFDSNSGTGTATTASGAVCSTLTMNSSTCGLTLGANLTMTGALTLTLGTISLASYTLSSGTFFSSNSNTRTLDFGTGNLTLTGNSATIWSTSTVTNFTIAGTPVVNCTYAGATGTRTISPSTSFTETNAPSFNVSAGTDIIDFGTSSRRVGSVNFTGFSGTLVNYYVNQYGNLTLSSGMTLTDNANILQFLGTGTQTITTNGKTIPISVTMISGSESGTRIFADALTIGTGKSLTMRGTVKFTAGTTNTSPSFVFLGTSTNQLYVQSTIAGTQYTLSQASGTVNAAYTTIQDCIATGGATWNAYYANGNVDGGNNTNWNFGGTPSYDAEYGYKLRSFTERGRF